MYKLPTFSMFAVPKPHTQYRYLYEKIHRPNFKGSITHKKELLGSCSFPTFMNRGLSYYSI